LTASSFSGTATNATNVVITDTTSTVGTYYPTFVSSNSGNQGVKVDSQYLLYSASTNTLQNPTFLVSDGTDTATEGGLNIKTVGSSPTNKQITLYSNTITIDRYLSFEIKNSITNTAISQNFYTGSNTLSARYSLFAYNPTLSAFSQLDLNNTIGDLTCNSPNGDGTQEVGFQVDCSNNWATMYYNPDTTGSAYVNALRIDTNDLRYGTILASQGQAGVLPPLTNTYFKVDSAGVTTTNSVTLSNAPTTANQASRLGQVGLVKISSVSVAITGSASVQNLSFANLFNSSYKNYRIILEPTTQVAFTQYPSYALQAFLGTGTLPTIASLYGFEMISSATSVVTPVYTSGATLSSAPLIFAVSSNTNKEVIFDIQNVGYATTATQQVSLMCKSVYGNPGVSGASDRTISCSSISGATITGLTIQQSILTAGNNFTLRAVVYGYNQL